MVGDLLRSNVFQCIAIYGLQEWVITLDPFIYDFFSEQIEIINDFELEKLAAYSTANKVVGVFKQRKCNENISLESKLTLMLDDIRDPGNFGTIIRTADWFGIENIICSEHTVEMYNPKVVQSTMVSLANINIIYADLNNWLEEHPNMTTYAAVLDGESIHEVNLIKESILIIGNESTGINPGILHLVNQKITIPKKGNAESLNAAVATGILLNVFNK